jgi:transcription elongation factor Elf1
MSDKKEKPKCEHQKTYVAVRHVSGIRLIKCQNCGISL